jgi:hypothetical protein
MQIRKTYTGINPQILLDEIKEFVRSRGVEIDQDKMETYSSPQDSSSFIYRGTLTFKIQGKESLRVHIVGYDKGETKMILDACEDLFSKDQIVALEDELDFMLGPYESRT